MAVSIMAGIPALKELNADLRRRMDQAVATSSQLGLNAHGPGQRAHDRPGEGGLLRHAHPSINWRRSQPRAAADCGCTWDPSVIKEIESPARGRSGLQSISDGKVLRVPVRP